MRSVGCCVGSGVDIAIRSKRIIISIRSHGSGIYFSTQIISCWCSQRTGSRVCQRSLCRVHRINSGTSLYKCGIITGISKVPGFTNKTAVRTIATIVIISNAIGIQANHPPLTSTTFPVLVISSDVGSSRRIHYKIRNPIITIPTLPFAYVIGPQQSATAAVFLFILADVPTCGRVCAEYKYVISRVHTYIHRSKTSGNGCYDPGINNQILWGINGAKLEFNFFVV